MEDVELIYNDLKSKSGIPQFYFVKDFDTYKI